MSFFSGSRFTAMLATIAVFGAAGTLWWAIETRADLKSGQTNRVADRASPSKSAGRALRAKEARSNKFASLGRGERPQPNPSGWIEDRGQLPERSTTHRVFVNYADPSVENRGADMPLPLPPARSDLESRQAKAPESPAFAAPLPVENPKRQTRESKAEPTTIASTSAKQPARSYYLEKFVEQGDAGEVKFRYRRRPCEPPNMPDVCFMPPSSRRNIVVERR